MTASGQERPPVLSAGLDRLLAVPRQHRGTHHFLPQILTSRMRMNTQGFGREPLGLQILQNALCLHSDFRNQGTDSCSKDMFNFKMKPKRLSQW